MNVAYICLACDSPVRQEVDDDTTQLVCTECQSALPIPPGAYHGGCVNRCLVCPSQELYVRKDFPQRLGVTIVVLGLATSCIPWYFHQWFWTFCVLFATALMDVILYATMGNLLQCYRCQAQYRGLAESQQQRPFDLEVHERHRQEVARIQQSRSE